MNIIFSVYSSFFFTLKPALFRLPLLENCANQGKYDVDVKEEEKKDHNKAAVTLGQTLNDLDHTYNQA